MSLALLGAGKALDGAAALAYSAEVLADAPIGYWRLNETSGTNAADSGSGGNAGTYAGTFTLGVAGNTTDGDKAVSLAGTVNSMVTIPSTFPTLNGSALTAECFIKPNDITSGQILFGAMNPSSPFAGWGFGLAVITDNCLQYWSGTTAAWRESTAVITAAGVWYHVAVTVPASAGTIRFYVNGVAAGTASAAPPNTDANAKSIGAHRSGVSPYSGPIDEMAIYNTELSAGRIAAHVAAR